VTHQVANLPGSSLMPEISGFNLHCVCKIYVPSVQPVCYSLENLSLVFVYEDSEVKKKKETDQLSTMAQGVEPNAPQNVSITPLLTRLWPSPGDANVTADEIALAISHIFTGQLSPVQTGALLTCLHFTGWDRRADVIAKCAEAMRVAAAPVNKEELQKVVKAHGKAHGKYEGGLVSILLKITINLLIVPSVTLWAPAVTLIIRSTFQPHLPF